METSHLSTPLRSTVHQLTEQLDQQATCIHCISIQDTINVTQEEFNFLIEKFEESHASIHTQFRIISALYSQYNEYISTVKGFIEQIQDLKQLEDISHYVSIDHGPVYKPDLHVLNNLFE